MSALRWMCGIAMAVVLLAQALTTTAASANDAPGQAGAEKRIAFEMRDKPWSSVLEWLSDQSGLPVITTAKPTGTFNFISPRNRTYTIPEIIDILNEGLLSQKYLLIRRDQSFTLVPADEKIDPAVLPRVKVEDLPERGNTEMVSVVLPLSSLVAEDLAPEVKKMMGPFGEVVAMTKANQLVLQDTAGNIKRIIKTIRDIEDNEKGQAESYSHTCQYIKARDAEQILTKLLGDPHELLRLTQPMQQPLGFSPFGRGGFPGGQGGPMPAMPAAPAGPAPKIRMHYVTADERTNTILVTGPADKIAQAKDILKRIDIPQAGQQPVLTGPSVLKSYPVPQGSAEALAKTLTEIYKNSATIRITSAGNSTILVWAGPDDQIEIARQIIGSTEKTARTEVVPLMQSDAAKISDTLKGMFGDAKDPKTGAPFIDADTQKNAIIVRGTADQVGEVKAALLAMGEAGQSDSNMRVITLDKGSAATLAEAIGRLLPQMRPNNPVHVLIPGREPPPGGPPAAPTKAPEGGGEEQEAQEPPPPPNAPAANPPSKPAVPDKKPAETKPPITITAFGNRLVVTSDDPQALATVQELVKLLTTTQPGEGDFAVIRLKNASAEDVAKVLEEAFNGTKPQSNNQNQGGFPFAGGGFGRFGPQPAAVSTVPPRVRVVADPATNSLLVRASPLDMVTIRNLIDTALDIGTTESKAVARTWIIGPLKHANAYEVANVIRDVYREHMNNNPLPGMGGGFGGFGGPGFFRGGRQQQNQNVDANGNPRAVTLSLGIDDRTNSLVVSCSNALYEDVKKLAEQLDLAAKDSTRTVKVVSIKGIDPLLVQQAVDAIQGRRTTPTQTGMMMNQTGSFQPGGFNGQGAMIMPGTGTRGGFGAPAQTPVFRGNTGTGTFNNAFTPGTGNFNPGFNNNFNNRFNNGPPGNNMGPPGGRSSNQPPGGPGFFADRVKDDPDGNVLYDPRTDSDTVVQAPDADGGLHLVRLVALRAEETQSPTAPAASSPPGPGGTVVGPRSPVTAEALEELGVVVISGNNAADVEEVVRIIEMLQRLGAGAEAQIQLVPLAHADATSVSNTLSQLYSHVIIGATANTLSRTGGAQTPAAAGASAGSVVLVPVPRMNAILVAAPASRLNDIVQEIRRLDQPLTAQGKARPFQLKKASAARVAALLGNFYAGRYATETTGQDQIRITYDDSTNTVFVQAAPGDMAEIEDLIWRLDNTVSLALNDLRIIPLKNVPSDELAAVLQQALTEGLVSGTTPAPSGPGAPGAGGAIRPPGAAPTPAGAQPSGVTTRSTSLRFISGQRGVSATVAGMLEDVHVTSDPRINALIVSAPEKSMDLIVSLIHELDILPSLHAEISIFTLKRADATAMANLLQQLFLGTPGGTAAAAPAAPGPALGAPGAPGGLGVAPIGAAVGASAATARPVAPMALAGTSPTGTPLIELRITVDPRTNSLIIGGSKSDLAMAEAVISRLEDTDVQLRKNEVYALRNAAAADVANALTSFLTGSLRVLQQGQQLTAFQEIERDVVVVPEPITNKLLVSATPRYFGEVLRLIEELDAPPAQVAIQALIAEVDLNNDQEFGIELGLQSPVLFRRGITPLQDLFGPNGGVNYTNPGLVPTGVTVNNSINPAALPGYGFNTTNALGQNPAADPGIVGFQAINNLGVGRASPLNSGVGGFVFSASSDAVSVLVRALQMQGRIEILARPQVTTLDNQQSDIVVGQSVPYVEGATVNSLGNVTPIINYRNVGVVLQVTPRISPEGKVIMRVHPEISSVAASTINLGNGINATQFNDEFVDTTVVVEDGETVAIGGMISKHDTKTENKVPWLGDLPGVGALFRFRQQDKNKTELLVILTPHIVRTRMDADVILGQESKRMDWTLGEVMRIHGSTGMEPILHPDPPQGPVPEGVQPPCLDGHQVPEVMPVPRTLPPASPPAPGARPGAPPEGFGPSMSKSNGSNDTVPASSFRQPEKGVSHAPLSAPVGGRGQGEGGTKPTPTGTSSVIVPASASSEPRRWNVNPPG